MVHANRLGHPLRFCQFLRWNQLSLRFLGAPDGLELLHILAFHPGLEVHLSQLVPQVQQTLNKHLKT